MSKDAVGKVIVIGGCGFVGGHIVEHLLSSSNPSITVLSRQAKQTSEPISGVEYYNANITSLASILEVFERIQPDVVFHAVSPSPTKATAEEFQSVNVEGTKNVIKACQKVGVKALIYTSTSAVVQASFKMACENADESSPVVKGNAQEDPYSRTKARAEGETLVLAANRQSDLLTCSLRAQAIFGERDSEVLPALMNVYYNGNPNAQIGSNTNLFDFTYVGNLAQAHLLAACALLRTFASSSLSSEDEKVDGEAFFVTNDEPMLFWDFSRAVFKGLGDKGEGKIRVFSQRTALLLAKVLRGVYGIAGKTPPLTENLVWYCCMTAYFSNEKAKKRLGYEVEVPMTEAIERSVKWFVERKNVEAKV